MMNAWQIAAKHQDNGLDYVEKKEFKILLGDLFWLNQWCWMDLYEKEGLAEEAEEDEEARAKCKELLRVEKKMTEQTQLLDQYLSNKSKLHEIWLSADGGVQDDGVLDLKEFHNVVSDFFPSFSDEDIMNQIFERSQTQIEWSTFATFLRVLSKKHLMALSKEFSEKGCVRARDFEEKLQREGLSFAK